ncbi:MAG: OB-fold nucleic acid binding domain-containing protein, partial [Lachnospiraceae bacterium]|nr:OB-fold nucleic acid binding domain-containing protein [Lachnospiraceae bacterium]
MEFMTGVKKQATLEIRDLMSADRTGKTVKVNGAVHSVNDMGAVTFVILRKREGLLQCIYEEKTAEFDVNSIREGSTLELEGILEQDERAPHGIEIRIRKVRVLSEPAEAMPLPVSKWKMNTSLDAKLNYRSISLRNIRERAKFKLQEGIVRGFRNFLYEQEFTEIHTPKIGARSAEGGANLFRLEYFHRPAILQQSPQLYKQMMVGVFDRVFETGPVFR